MQHPNIDVGGHSHIQEGNGVQPVIWRSIILTVTRADNTSNALILYYASLVDKGVRVPLTSASNPIKAATGDAISHNIQILQRRKSSNSMDFQNERSASEKPSFLQAKTWFAFKLTGHYYFNIKSAFTLDKVNENIE